MNLLITGAWNGAKDYMEEIRQKGHEIVFLQYEKDALPCAYEWVEGVICNGLFSFHPIEKFKNLKYIQLTSAGFDRVPMDYVNLYDIQIHNAKGVYSIPIAEFILSGVLQLYKQQEYFRNNQKQHVWEKHRGLRELNGKTVVIIGSGSIGTECAKRFTAFDCHVIGVGRNSRQAEHYEYIATIEDLDKELLSKADIVVLTVPLTDDTRHLMNRERFSKIKEDAILVNVARGQIVDTDALIEVLQDQKLGGAVLDVFETEPLEPESPLWDMENVVVTPHNSFVGENNQERLAQIILYNLG